MDVRSNASTSEATTVKRRTHDPDGLPCPSPDCTSSDGFKWQNERWGHCFKCGHNERRDSRANGAALENKNGERVEATTEERKPAASKPKTKPIPIGERFAAWEDRKISRETLERYKCWQVGEDRFFANFRDGEHVGTKRKNIPNKKDQKWTGEQADLFGAHLFPAGSAPSITLTEGEEDSMAAYEMMGSKWPAVSVVNGTGTALQDVKRNYEYLNSFDKIVLSFDSDEAGRKTAKAIAGLFGAGKCRVMSHSRHKDANDYKLAGEAGAYTKEWWQAAPFMPDGLKLGSSLWDSIVNRPNHFSTDYPWKGLNLLTYGIRLSEMIVVTAETKVGKTSILKEIEYMLLMNEEIKKKGYGVGFMHLEEPEHDTALGLMSIYANKPFHLPDTVKTEKELKEAYDAVINNERVVVWDHFGSNSVDAILNKVRHMAALGCKYIVLDHLSIVVSDQAGDERKQLDEISTKLKMLCMELNIALICVIHQNRAGQIRGTAGVEQIANLVIKLHRDKLDTDQWRRNITKVVVQENRFCGRTGIACYLWYNEMTARLVELDEEEIKKYEAGETLRDFDMPF